MAFRRKRHNSFSESITFTSVEDNDLTVFKQSWGDTICIRTIFGDKICFDFEYFNESKRLNQHIEILTPVKGVKGKSDEEKQRNKAFNDLFSIAVSKVIQSIESFFNWLNKKTKIQRAHKVRLTYGLLAYVVGKIATAFIYLIF